MPISIFFVQHEISERGNYREDYLKYTIGITYDFILATYRKNYKINETFLPVVLFFVFYANHATLNYWTLNLQQMVNHTCKL
jgi:hypothetical protein